MINDTMETLIGADGLPYVAVYKHVPLLANPLFAIICVLFVAFIIFGLWYWFKIACRNRTNVIIHMPNGKRPFYSFKKFTGNEFKIPSLEKDRDGKPIIHSYRFKAECLEDGYFGKYIEYDYGIIEPINPRARFKEHDKLGLSNVFKFVSGLLNTDLAVDLLLSQKFKDFVKMMLILILIASVIVLLLTGYNTYILSSTKETVCSLANNNQTVGIIQDAIRGI